MIFDFVAELLQCGFVNEVDVVVKNSRGSYDWLFRWFCTLLRKGLIDVDFQHGRRVPPKSCAPGVGPRRSGEYSVEMAAAAASIMTTEVTMKGRLLVSENLNPMLSDAQPHKKRRAVAAKQPRSKQLPTVIAEFSEFGAYVFGGGCSP